MIKEIEKPEHFIYKGFTKNNKYFFDDEKNEFFSQETFKINPYKDPYLMTRFLNKDGFKTRVIYTDNNKVVFKSFFKDKLFHNLDGPAISQLDLETPVHNYIIDGKDISKNDFLKITNHLICQNCKDFCKQECFI